MKTIFFIIALIPLSVFANWFPYGKEGAKTVYTKKQSCESAEGQSCYNITGKDLRKQKIGFLNPVVAETSDCDDAADCQSRIDELSFSCSEGVPTFDDKANWPGLDFAGAEPERPAEGWFLWCQVETLVIDSTKAAEADAADAARAAEQAQRETKKAERLVSKDSCVAAVNAGGVLTGPQVRDCLDILVKEVFSSEIPAEDL